jgi:hypothetical protein
MVEDVESASSLSHKETARGSRVERVPADELVAGATGRKATTRRQPGSPSK